MRAIRWGIASLAVCLAVSHASAGFTVSRTTPVLVDGGSTSRSIEVTVLEPGNSSLIEYVNYLIDFAKAKGESFDGPLDTGAPNLNEIVFLLNSPNGTTVTRIDKGSSSPGSSPFDGTTGFDYDALTAVNQNPDILQSGGSQPTGPGSFGYIQKYNRIRGAWTLDVEDATPSNALRYRSFTLLFNDSAFSDPGMNSTPTPSGAVLLATGFVGMGGFNLLRLRKKIAI